MNRSVTAYADTANLTRAALACATGHETIINGIPFKGLDGRERIVVTVLEHPQSLKGLKVFRDLKRKGYLASWAVA